MSDDWVLNSYYYTLDPELRIIHAFRNCASLKYAVKYKYAIDKTVKSERDAEDLDHLVEEERYKICGACYGREQMLSRRDRRRARPGFRYQPAGYIPPPPRPHRRATKPTTKD